MPVYAIDAYAEVTSFGAGNNSVWATVPPSTIQHFTSPQISVGMAQAPRMDFSPPGTSAGATLPACTISVAGAFDAPYSLAVGSTASVIYTNLQGGVIRDTWTRTS